MQIQFNVCLLLELNMKQPDTSRQKTERQSFIPTAPDVTIAVCQTQHQASRGLPLLAAGMLSQQASSSCDTSQAQISIRSTHSSKPTRHTAGPHMASGLSSPPELQSRHITCINFLTIHKPAFLRLVEIIMRCLLGNALCFNKCTVRKEELGNSETEASQQRLVIMYALQRNQSLLSLSSIVFKRILYWTQSN